MIRHIFTQGDYDGACFLYALANSYKTITGKTPSCKAWDKGVRFLKHADDFLGCCIGTTEHFSAGSQILRAVAIMLDSFGSDGPVVRWKHLPEVKELTEIASFIDRQGVVLFRYNGKTAHVGDIDHWVCGVSSTQKPFRLHLACSYRRVQDDRTQDKRYREHYHRALARYSNNWVDDRHEMRIISRSVFRIWKPD